MARALHLEASNSSKIKFFIRAATEQKEVGKQYQGLTFEITIQNIKKGYLNFY